MAKGKENPVEESVVAAIAPGRGTDSHRTYGYLRQGKGKDSRANNNDEKWPPIGTSTDAGSGLTFSPCCIRRRGKSWKELIKSQKLNYPNDSNDQDIREQVLRGKGYQQAEDILPKAMQQWAEAQKSEKEVTKDPKKRWTAIPKGAINRRSQLGWWISPMQ